MRLLEFEPGPLDPDAGSLPTELQSTAVAQLVENLRADLMGPSSKPRTVTNIVRMDTDSANLLLHRFHTY